MTGIQDVVVSGTGGAPVPALVLSTELSGQGLSLRRESDDDVAFSRRLYVSLRWEEVAPLIDWSDQQKIAFLESQFAAQRQHYGLHYSAGDFAIIEHDGTPVGRLYLYRSKREIRVVDIGFLPEWRNRGFGTLFLRAVFAEGTEAGKKVSIHVEVFNPARRLYQRLGFREISQDGPYLLMEWTP